METKITLLDGRDMTVYLKEHQPDKFEDNNLHLDTNGQHLSIKEHGLYKPDDSIIERGLSSFQIQIFLENAWFLLENADRVMSDSRMFFSRFVTKRNLPNIGMNGVKNTAIGIFLEWWLNFSEKSIDQAGNLIWYMTGSPFSGQKVCYSVTLDGKKVKKTEKPDFFEVLGSFREINKIYSKVKEECEFYSFEETLIKLRGEEYGQYLKDLLQEHIDLAIVYNDSPNWPEDGTNLKKMVKASRKTQMQIKWREIMQFYEIFVEKEKRIDKMKEEDNTLKYRELLHELAELSTEFISETFGRNVNRICLTDVINYAKYRKSLGLDE